MFLLENELTQEIIIKIIDEFRLKIRPELDKYHNYYIGNHPILAKQYKDPSKPCNRIITNYAKQITENYTGYMTGKDISYTSQDDFTAVQDVLNYNDVQQQDTNFLKSALIYGRAYEIHYIDEDGKERFKLLDSRQCIPVYKNNLNEDLVAVIRFYAIDLFNSDDSEYMVEVYETNRTRYYRANSGISALTFVDEVANPYNQVPIVVFELDNSKSIFDCILSLQDAYNTLLSAEIDDFQAFVDAYLLLKGVEVDEDSVAQMRTNRVLDLGFDGSAEFLTKSINDTQIENILKNINDTIHKISNSPDFSQESFGTSSGIALRYRLLGFENQAGAIEKIMTKALQKRIELICSILSLTSGEEMWRDVKIQFKRNLPADLQETVNIVNQLRGLVSDKTLLSLLPFVDDVESEIDSNKVNMYELLGEQNQNNRLDGPTESH